MKYLFITALVYFIACTSNIKKQESSEKNNPSDKIITIDNKTATFFKDSIDQLLNGLWVDDTYLEEVKQKRSVYATHEKYYLMYLDFSLDNLKSNIPSVFGSTVNEGGYDTPIQFDTIRQKYILDSKRAKTETNNFENFFEVIIIQENLLKIYFPKTKKAIHYRKYSEKAELFNLLFEGSYVDSQTKKIVSVNNGKFTGFSDTSPYVYVISHFVFNINYDAIILTKEKEVGDSWPKGDLYKYEFIKDTLRLYAVKTDWEEFEHIVDTKPNITLIKIN